MQHTNYSGTLKTTSMTVEPKLSTMLSDLSLHSTQQDDFHPPRSPSRLDFCGSDEEAGVFIGDDDSDGEPRVKIPKSHWFRAFDESDQEDPHFQISTMKAASQSSDTFILPASPFEEDASSEGSEYSSDEEIPTCIDISPSFPTVKFAACTPEPSEASVSVIEEEEDVPAPPAPALMTSAERAVHRLNYPHHGYSRSALLHQKWLWHSRREEWIAWENRDRDSKTGVRSPSPEHSIEGAYSGITEHYDARDEPLPRPACPPSGWERELEDVPPGHVGQDTDAPIYPRIGDLSALRDPYCVNVDRCFHHFPLWMIHKTLYVFDMHQRFIECIERRVTARSFSGSSAAPRVRGSVRRKRAPTPPPSLALSVVTPSEISTSATASGSASTSAPVVASSSSDPSLTPALPSPWEEGRTPADGSDESFSSRMGILPRPDLCPSGSLSDKLRSHRPWELSWYARWELLIGLVQHDSAILNGGMRLSTSSSSPCSLLASESPGISPTSSTETIEAPAEVGVPLRRFSSARSDEPWVLQDSSDDDEDDYGTIVANPTFERAFDEYMHAGFTPDTEYQ
ncbi:hypothetical protein CONPUDRAFT_167328 [Coniophora puteana RWD-64-598 SS2]|uniref:Uncharacterized protein n=1 Tax=Coniophora puteana (strain RWD-64-598) TaxID=741705 RepID=A0A5M3MI34_CONPW|nr:uncharacterized protein CONPUDRAFT_167328 [Coniophora puteana RWD-64-598 SS2]EIW78291.1 hypothetical protein CONPUDRAFT_167328 [Coniophora puteana RWD-64-598 SS2]